MSVICSTSSRFFSPPENPTLSGRRSISMSILSAFDASRTRRMKSGVIRSPSPRDRRWAFSAAFKNVIVATPGISIGYWNARKTPFWARSSGSNSRRFSPSSSTSPEVTS